MLGGVGVADTGQHISDGISYNHSNFLLFAELPACLADAGDFSLIGHLAEADAADAILAEHGVGTAADTAAGIGPGRELGFTGLLDFMLVFATVLSS